MVITTSAPTRRIFHDLVGGGDSCCGGERDFDAAGENREPQQWQANLIRLAELEVGQHLEARDVEIRLVESIEQHECVGAGPFEGQRHAADRAEIGAELDRDRD